MRKESDINTKGRILVIESREASLDRINGILSPLGYEVYRAKNQDQGIEALESAGQNPFMLVISSFTMEGVKGDAVLKKAKEVSPETLRILLAEAAYIETMISAINTARIHSCITEPFEDQDLVNQVNDCRNQYLATLKAKTIKQTLQRQNRQLFQIANNYKKKQAQNLAQMDERKKKIRILESRIKAGRGNTSQNNIPSILQLIEDKETEYSPQGFADTFIKMSSQIRDIFQTALFTYRIEPLAQSYQAAAFRARQAKEHAGVISRLMPLVRMLLSQSQAAGINLFGLEFKKLMDNYFKLSFSQNRATAALRMTHANPKLTNLHCIKYYLSWHRITYGIVEDNIIETWLASVTPKSPAITVARGLEPIQPVNGEIKYNFPTDFRHAGTVNEDGSINFQDRGEIPFVKAYTFLAAKVTAREGKPGIDVTGNPIQVPEPSDRTFEAGPGTTLSEDGQKIFAAVDGQPHLDAMGRVTVCPELKIEGDLGLETGDVVFDGNVVVNGAVKKGFKVKGASLTAKEIDGAEIDLTGDLNVSFGIIDTKLVNVKGSVQAKFIRNSKINAFGDLIIQKEIIDSTIRVSGACINKNGAIINSEISANMGIEAGSIGSEGAAPSKLTVGKDEHTLRLVAKLDADIRLNTEAAVRISREIAALEEEDQALHGTISKHATIQDRAQLEIKAAMHQIARLKSSGHLDTIPNIQRQVKKLKADAADAEEKINSGFQRQDAIAREIAHKNDRISQFTDKNRQLEGQKKLLLEYTATKQPKAQVRVAKKVLSQTQIIGPNTKKTLHHDVIRAKILEIARISDESGGLKFYEMKITNY